MSETLTPVISSGMASGLANMLKKENGLWWGTRKWIVQMTVWTAIIVGLLALILYVASVTPATGEDDLAGSGGLGAAGLMLFFSLCGFVFVVGVIILTYDLVIRERESGTAEWVLSKPLSRKAFLLSKLIASAIAITLIIVMLQGILSYVVISLFNGSPIALLPFIGGLALLWLACMFYLAMLILLGTLTTSRGTVLGASIGFYVLGNLVPSLIPESSYIMPWSLADLALATAMSTPLSTEMMLPVAATVVWIVLFIAGALWKIEKLEI